MRLVARRPRPAHPRPGRRRGSQRRDPPHLARDPAHQGEVLRGAGLRLRLRVRPGQPLRDGRDLRHGQRRALALLRPRDAYASRGNSTQPNNLNSDFFFQRIKDDRVVERLIAQPPPQGPLPRDPRRACAATSAGYNALPARHRRRPAARPALPRQGVGAADHRDRRLPALLPAGAAGQLGRGDRRDRRRPAARRRRAVGPPPPPGLRASCPTCRSATSAPTPSRSARPRPRDGNGPAARQPALPVGRAGALLPGAAHDPRQGRRDRRARCSACRSC